LKVDVALNKISEKIFKNHQEITGHFWVIAGITGFEIALVVALGYQAYIRKSKKMLTKLNPNMV
jgi:hypothetical protein